MQNDTIEEVNNIVEEIIKLTTDELEKQKRENRSKKRQLNAEINKIEYVKMRNGENYKDTTAGEALYNIINEGKIIKEKKIKRLEIEHSPSATYKRLQTRCIECNKLLLIQCRRIKLDKNLLEIKNKVAIEIEIMCTRCKRLNVCQFN